MTGWTLKAAKVVAMVGVLIAGIGVSAALADSGNGEREWEWERFSHDSPWIPGRRLLAWQLWQRLPSRSEPER